MTIPYPPPVSTCIGGWVEVGDHLECIDAYPTPLSPVPYPTPELSTTPLVHQGDVSGIKLINFQIQKGSDYVLVGLALILVVLIVYYRFGRN